MQINFTGSVDFTKPITIVDSNGTTHTLVEQTIPTPTPIPTGTADYWRGDGEAGLEAWAKIVEAAPGRISVVSDPIGQRGKVFRFELRGDDVTYGERVQLDSGISGGTNAHYINDGDEAFYGCSFYLPSNSLAKIAKWRQFLQFKGMHTGSPPVQIGFNDDNWRLYYRPTITSDNLLKWQTPSRKNVWEKFMFHIKWSQDPKVGFIEMYYNGSLVVPKFFTSNIHVENGIAIRNIVDIGDYRDSSIATTDILYIDGFVAGKSYTEVEQ